MSTRVRQIQAKWALWHVTAQCNIECDYCYGSFEGSSYKAQWKPGGELPTEMALEVPAGLRLAGFEQVHINGGEPLLRPDISTIVHGARQCGLGVWLLTNGTVRHHLLRDLAASGDLDVIAISLDSADQQIGDSVRGLTKRALKGLQAALDGGRHSITRVGVYVVLTQRNIAQARDLFNVLEAEGVDYVNVQPVYLPIGHSRRADLGLDASYADQVADVLQDLASRRFDCTSPLVRRMAVEGLGLPPTPVEYCFAAAGDYAYVSPEGVVLGCPSKPSGLEIGRIFRDRHELAAILQGREARHPACSYQSGDCLGMYEMAMNPSSDGRRQVTRLTDPAPVQR